MPNNVQRILGVLLLFLLSPVLLVLAAFVQTTMGRPVIFSQERLGKDGQPFLLVKFRTMTDLRDRNGLPLPDEQRLGRFGRFLRSSSLDELPELWNVAKGEMAFVGPRPLPTRYQDRYSDMESRRNEVLPGLTGWAQVNGRNLITWNQRLALDAWYVDHRSVRLDVKILAMTVTRVIKREGISSPATSTMEELQPWVSRKDLK